MTPSQYVLGSATISACITYLLEEGTLEMIEEEGELLWRRCS
jgi:hypothetical protein